MERTAVEAKDYLVGELLRGDRHFLVPIYQRRYQWTEAELLPFWADVVAKADEVLEGRSRYQHYMGALIWVPSGDGLTTKLHVVDGQQRLTTFQLLLAALREIAELRGFSDLSPALESCIFNSTSAAARDGNRVKLYPTPADRDLIQDIIASNRETIKRKYPEYYFNNGNLKVGQSPRALVNYLTICRKIDDYARYGLYDISLREAGDAADGDSDPQLARQRLAAVQEALLEHLKIVVISLGEGDDAQVIFETLNSKGKPLLAMDLVRNNIFHRAEAQGEQASELYRRLWGTFEGGFWEQPAPRARPVRPRIDHFLSHALTAQTGKQTAIKELYAEYRGFARPLGRSRFNTVEDELRALTQYAETYRVLEGDLTADSALYWIGAKLAAWESTVAYPVVFQTALSNLPTQEKAAVYRTIYAYLVRRAVCGLPNKSLGVTFSRLTTRFLDTGASLDALQAVFAESSAPTHRFPDDTEFMRGLVENPLYLWFSGGRLPDVLWEFECAARGRFTEALARPDGLWIEHVLPQSWTEGWPDENGRAVLKQPGEEAFERRAKMVHTVGNLTLTTDQLNMSLGNQQFAAKAAKLSAESLFVLNREIASNSAWTEREIEARSRRLAEAACRVWPTPDRARLELATIPIAC